MKVIGFYRSLPITEAESLIDVELPKPVASKHDLLVKVEAVSVNPVDTKQRRRLHDAVAAEPQILGWDAAGVVEAVGSEVTLFKPGDAVWYAGSITRSGSYSEYHLVDERIVGRKPANLDFAQAAALPLTALTAWEGLHTRLDIPLEPAANVGKRILVIGAAGGVGSITTQLARLAGLEVIGTASRAESAAFTLAHGSSTTINHYQPFVPQLQASGIDGVDYVFITTDPTGHWHNIVEALKPQGRIVSILPLSGAVNFGDLFDKSGSLSYELMFTRSKYQTEDMVHQGTILNRLASLVESGQVQTTLTECLTPMNAAHLRQAHALVESGKMLGKVVVAGW
jgi:zinc-binding alcohol dehydrogenase family protein